MFWVQSVVPGGLSPPLPFSPGVEEPLAVGRPCSTSAPRSRAGVGDYAAGDSGDSEIAQPGGMVSGRALDQEPEI